MYNWFFFEILIFILIYYAIDIGTHSVFIFKNNIKSYPLYKMILQLKK